MNEGIRIAPSRVRSSGISTTLARGARTRAGLAAAATGLLLGLAIGLLVVMGDAAAVPFIGVGALAIWAVLRSIASDRAVRTLRWFVALSFATHLLLMAVIHYVLVAVGRGGFLPGDDYGYFDLSWRLAQYLHGQDVLIYWSAEAYLLNNYFVQLETGLFWLVGPQVLGVKILNVAMLHVAGIIMFDLVRGRHGSAAGLCAAGIMLFFPSLTLWSVLNLKDALALLLLVVVLWCAERFTVDGRTRWLIIAIVILAALAGVRRYVFLLLALLVPFATLLAERYALRRRLVFLVPTLAACGALMALSGSGFLGLGWFTTDAIATLERTRLQMAAGARTAIDQGSQPVIARPGDRFVIRLETAATAPSGAAVATPAIAQRPGSSQCVVLGPAEEPRVIVVGPFTLILLETEPAGCGGTSTSGGGNIVYVRPNDIIVVAGGDRDAAVGSPAPLQTLLVGGDRKPPPEIRSEDSLRPLAAAWRSLLYLPRGLTYALFAPFPWATETLGDRLAVAETALWYALLAAAIATVWRSRRRPGRIALLGLYAAGVIVILALFEGNVGTLFRHRSMVLPAIAALAAPTLVGWARWLAMRRA